MMNKEISYRPLSKVKELIENCGFAISYPFEDLVFIDSNAFLVQFDDTKMNSFFIHFNIDLEENVRDDLKDHLKKNAQSIKLNLCFKGTYRIESSVAEGQIDLVFS